MMSILAETKASNQEHQLNKGQSLYLYLDEFGYADMTTWAWWQEEHRGDTTFEEWCVELLRRLDDDELRRLADYLLPSGPPVDEELAHWEADHIRVFLSHTSTYKSLTTQIAAELSYYGAHGFVAHEDIDPGKEWMDVIQASLVTCDALVALLTPDFHESSWTDQEVGYVMGHGKFSIAVRAGIDPYGFLGAVQGIQAPPHQPGVSPAREIARDIVQALVAEDRTNRKLRDALVAKLVRSTSFDMSNNIVDVLKQCPEVSEPQYNQMVIAMEENDQLAPAYNVEPYLQGLSSKFPPRLQSIPVPSMGDAPF